LHVGKWHPAHDAAASGRFSDQSNIAGMRKTTAIPRTYRHSDIFAPAPLASKLQLISVADPSRTTLEAVPYANAIFPAGIREVSSELASSDSYVIMRP
jgi:hypothetical protein